MISFVQQGKNLELAPIPNLVALESLRGWMAWLVVVGHTSYLTGIGFLDYGLQLPGLVIQLIQSTDAAVRIFIILSGFAITNLVLSKGEPYPQYIGRRAFRIFPIYLFCLFLAIAVTGLYATAYIDNPLTADGTQALRLAAQEENFIQHLLLHLTLLHGVMPHSVLTYTETAFLAPAWTISLEWQFYLIAPAIIWALLRFSRNGNIFWVTLALLLAVKVCQRLIGGDYVHESVLPLAFEYFLLGMLSRISIGFRKGPNSVELFISVAMTFMVIGWREALMWSVFFLISLSEVGILKFNSRVFCLVAWLAAYNPVSRAFGRWSYSTYLIHVPLLAIVYGSYLRITGPESFSQTAAFALGILSCTLVAAASFFLYYQIEKRFIDMGRRFFSGSAQVQSPQRSEARPS